MISFYSTWWSRPVKVKLGKNIRSKKCATKQPISCNLEKHKTLFNQSFDGKAYILYIVIKLHAVFGFNSVFTISYINFYPFHRIFTTGKDTWSRLYHNSFIVAPRFGPAIVYSLIWDKFAYIWLHLICSTFTLYQWLYLVAVPSVKFS